jgi:hypothetical protein
MKKIYWSGYEWIPQERWGQVHHEKPHWWYDESCVSVDTEGNLHLATRLNPKEFDIAGEKVVSPIGVGLVSCTEKFGHGVFSIEAMLPTGAHLWPAFWMWSWDSWPPEIDVFEAYSDAKSRYLKPSWKRPIVLWNVQTNLHYEAEGRPANVGGLQHWIGCRNPRKRFVTYALDWDPNYVDFYYNGRLVRSIRDPHILAHLNSTRMNVIINNGVTGQVSLTNPPKSNFVIRSFEYEPKAVDREESLIKMMQSDEESGLYLKGKEE